MATGRACEFVKYQASNPPKAGVERAISPVRFSARSSRKMLQCSEAFALMRPERLTKQLHLQASG